MKHYAKSELTDGLCTACGERVNDLISERKVCTTCAEMEDEDIASLENEEGEDNDY